MARHVVFPVLFREKGDPLALSVEDSIDELLCLVDEFADIIEDFECWDSTGRRVDLAQLARALLARREVPIPEVVGQPDMAAVWGAVVELAEASGVSYEGAEDKSAADAMRRVKELRG